MASGNGAILILTSKGLDSDSRCLHSDGNCIAHFFNEVKSVNFCSAMFNFFMSCGSSPFSFFILSFFKLVIFHINLVSTL